MEGHKFGWLEVLVLALLFGLAISLFLPMGIHRREPSRRRTCMNNQKQLAIACLAYESAHCQFPGYANWVGEGDRRLKCSWLVQLCPHLERNDLWKAWNEGEPVSRFYRLVICPSAPPEDTSVELAPLSYVVNCGLPGDDDSPADGVFSNQTLAEPSPGVSLDDIATHDGAHVTLLLSENIQAGWWTDTAEADVGMVWTKTPGRCSGLNQCADAGDRPHDIQYARPSSRHGDGAVVSFCDGHTYFLVDDIDYRVFQHLMTPDSKSAAIPGTLEEADY